MATQPSPFDLLPDEIVVKILEGVATRNAHEIRDGIFAQVCSFFRASSVCRRFFKLARDVKSVEWNLGTQDETVSLINFLLQQGVSLSGLRLNATVEHIDNIPIAYLFSAPFRGKIPSKITVNLQQKYEDDDCVIVKNPGLGLFVEQILARQNLVSFRLFNLILDDPFAVEGCKFPISNVRDLYLKNVLLRFQTIDNILERCRKLETAVLSLEHPRENTPQVFDLESASLLELVINVNREFPAVRLQTPSLVSFATGLKVQSIAAPNLQSLKLEFGYSPLGLPAFLGPTPALKHMSLNNHGFCRITADSYWAVIVRPLLLKFKGLETLQLGWSRKHKFVHMAALAALEGLILDIPPKLGVLLLVDTLLDMPGLPEASTSSWAKRFAEVLQADLHQSGYPSFSKLRSLKVALYNQNLRSDFHCTRAFHDAQTDALCDEELGFEQVYPY